MMLVVLFYANSSLSNEQFYSFICNFDILICDMIDNIYVARSLYSLLVIFQN